MEFTSKGKLYARLINAGKRTYPTDIPEEYLQETYDSYTYFYEFTPKINPPSES